MNNKGFTIIETLVAIAILMIAIAGPLTVAEKGLAAAELAHDQVIASYLAQDGIEYIKNVRDNNLLNASSGRTWLSQFTNASGQVVYCNSSANVCSVDTLNGYRDSTILNGTGNDGHLNINPCSISTTCQLYEGPNGYSPDSSSGSLALFSRYFYFTQNLNNPDEVKVTVMVTWTSGTLTNSVTYEDEIFNITK